MKVEFIGHSSILVNCGENKILCDPWYTGAAFNNGWKLLVEPKKDINELDFNYIWYSHEHPDHFSVPDLKKIDADKRKNITILFQETIDNKVRDFCIREKFNVIELKAFEETEIADGLTIINGTDGFDSWLSVNYGGKTILNLNDCRLDDIDELNRVKKKLGKIDGLYTQFGYANWAGNPDDKKGPEIGRKIVKSQLKNQIEILKPEAVIPFASFIWFCHEENKYWNNQAMGIEEAYKFLTKHSDNVYVFYPGDIWTPGKKWSNSKDNIESYTWAAAIRDADEFIKSPTVFMSELKESFIKMQNKIKANNDWDEILKAREKGILKPAIVHVEDLGIKIFFDITEDQLDSVDVDGWEISMSSDSLKYVMDYAWGRGTLMINARFKAVYSKFENFFKQTAIFYANNIGLKYPETFTEENLNKNSSFALELMREWEL